MRGSSSITIGVLQFVTDHFDQFAARRFAQCHADSSGAETSQQP